MPMTLRSHTFPVGRWPRPPRPRPPRPLPASPRPERERSRAKSLRGALLSLASRGCCCCWWLAAAAAGGGCAPSPWLSAPGRRFAAFGTNCVASKQTRGVVVPFSRAACDTLSVGEEKTYLGAARRRSGGVRAQRSDGCEVSKALENAEDREKVTHVRRALDASMRERTTLSLVLLAFGSPEDICGECTIGWHLLEVKVARHHGKMHSQRAYRL